MKLVILTFTKGKSVTAIHLQIDNKTALSYLVKMGGTCSQELLQVAKVIWEYLLASRIAVTAEYLPGSLNIQVDWQSRNRRDSSDWKLNHKMFSQIVKIRRIPQIDLFASRLNHQLPKYMSWHPRQLCSRFPSVLLEKPLWVCIPSILLNRKGTCQSKEGLVSSAYHNKCMTNSAMVRNVSHSVGSTSENSTQSDHIVTRQSVAKAPFAGRQEATVGDMEGFRKALKGEEVSKLAATLITNSRKSESVSNYQSTWQKWNNWCCEWEVNPFKSNIIEFLNFLAFLYEKGYDYSSINSHRSAIYAYHIHIDNNPIGQHPRGCALMTDIFNNHLPKPIYTFVWDIGTVLNYLSKLPDNLSLPIRVLSHQLALLLSLTAASRVSEICY